jgi:signal transduction histidine kinase
VIVLNDKNKIMSEETVEEINSIKKGFGEFYMRSSRRGIRIGLGVSTFCFILFGLVDPSPTQLLIRFLIICPVLICAFLLTYTLFFERYSQPILTATYIIVSVALIFIIRYTDALQPAREVYSVGLILCIIGSSAVRMRRNWALAATGLILAIFLFLSSNAHDRFIHFPILISAAVITVLYISSTEKILKDNYTTFILLNDERKNLKNIKEHLEDSDSLKSKLLSIIAHDLKGPTDNVAYILELLNSQKITQDEFGIHVGKLRAQLQGNQLLLENLLKWSLIKTDKNANLTKVNIREVVEECIGLLREAADRKGNVIFNKVEHTIVLTDPDIIKMVVRNLLSNAIKFTQQGKVTCSSTYSDDNLFSIIIEDNGRGMEKESADRLFNWNRRLSTPGTSNEKGSGIGLLVCAEFLRSLDGTLEFYTTPGKGTSVTIRFNTQRYNT